MAENSLFALLLRSPWWWSVLAGGIAFAAVRLILPVEYAIAIPIPFLVIAVLSARRQYRSLSPERAAEILGELRAMSWEQFAAALEAAYRNQGFEVSRETQGAADFRLVKSGAVSLLGCRRWKAARVGVEPVRELHAALRGAEANEGIFVSAGEVSEQAREFARQNGITLLHGVELALLLAPAARARRDSMRV